MLEVKGNPGTVFSGVPLQENLFEGNVISVLGYSEGDLS